MRYCNKIFLFVISFLLFGVLAASDSAVSNTFSLGEIAIKSNLSVSRMLYDVTFSKRISGEILVALNNQLDINKETVAEVYDLKGVFLDSFKFGKDNTTILRVKEYPIGMYLVKISLFPTTFSKKILIIK